MSKIPNVLIVTTKPWNINKINFFKNRLKLKIIADRKNFTKNNIKKIKPDLIFFPHWSWIVDKFFFNNYKCICFHMTDLPYGIGGTPLQNLLIRGKKFTTVSAFRMNGKIDQGPILLKKKMILSGNAESIYIRCSNIVFNMIKAIIKKYPKEKKQLGKKVYFKRILSSHLDADKIRSLSQLHDLIRMRDAPTYINSFLKFKKFKISFFNSKINYKEKKILASAKIEYLNENSK